MARIRTIKPEAFVSESLAVVTLTAERTFFGLLTQADDQGRYRDHAAIIAGQLWVLRPEHTPAEVEKDLAQLADAGLVCRYKGPDDKRYLHIVTWHKHQKINRASKSRIPACPRHNDPDGAPVETEAVEAVAPVSSVTHGAVADYAPNPHGGGSEGARSSHGSSAQMDTSRKGPRQKVFSEPSREPQGHDREAAVTPHGPDLGPRIVDLGSTPSGGASAPAADAVSAKQLIAEYSAACAHRPPQGVLGHLGREVRKLLAEGIAPDHIRAGLVLHRTKGKHPSILPSLVHEAMNAALAQPVIHRAWTNPADVEAAYGEQL
ncbi:hypothetical protein [Streptomyces sp. STCH 565 A]|uniref:hypothetical protein n=1 Tax=Streptomyces sp. STCH 565 A TaxID=2950532 RepID=UPI0020750D19|nr:hypothetical protein [Streptomyces sp. STCH 565 A]MCM8551879.1 hypothetical protein [Streptomyces sp. STCH 565 A]